MQQEDLLLDAKQFFEANKDLVGQASKRGDKSVVFDFDTLVAHSPKFSEVILQEPEEALRLLHQALNETGLIKDAKVRFSNLPKMQYVKVRNIRSKHLGNLIYIDGLVRQASDVRPQMIAARFECPACGSNISVLQEEKQFKEPFNCSCGRKGKFKVISKDLVDAQRLVIEEAPETLEGGEQPRRINVFLREDLVEPKMERKTTPGSKVEIIGVVKEIPITLHTGALTTRFDLMMEANNIKPLEETFEELQVLEEDVKEIQEFVKKGDVFKKLIEAISPSIWGYEEIKEALVLQLFGGVRKKKKDKTYRRGDIHVLLVGDPGVGKSIMLQYISKVAPKGRYVAGKAATSAGLTATVVKDEFLRGWCLEAGALVLANRGILCIDELEKMDASDRAAAHEALEQQQVTISKATIQATLKAETTVLAAANPKFGRFDPTRSIPDQIDLPPTLLNRFDLIFPLRDIPKKSHDEAIALHVLHELGEKKDDLIDPDFFRKYIAHAKTLKPDLTEAAVTEIKQFYVDLRNTVIQSPDIVKPMPITARQLEGLIRMSEASARVRLSKVVTKDDAKRAIRLMHYCLREIGLDTETGLIDIDRVMTGVPASTKNKMLVIRDAIIRLEDRSGQKLIPIDEIRKEVADKGIDPTTVDDTLETLKRGGEIFEPRKGAIQRI